MEHHGLKAKCAMSLPRKDQKNKKCYESCSSYSLVFPPCSRLYHRPNRLAVGPPIGKPCWPGLQSCKGLYEPCARARRGCWRGCRHRTSVAELKVPQFFPSGTTLEDLAKNAQFFPSGTTLEDLATMDRSQFAAIVDLSKPALVQLLVDLSAQIAAVGKAQDAAGEGQVHRRAQGRPA